MSGTLTLRELNNMHRLFWQEQNELRDRRVTDPTLRQSMLTELQGYQTRGVISRYQESVEAILEKFDRARRSTLAEQASRAGRAPKADALQKYIVALVSERPGLTEHELLARLEQDQGRELVQDIEDGAIYFTQPDGSEIGRTKKAPLTGLKDRLSRAKKQINSR